MAIYLVEEEARPHLNEGTLDVSMGRSLEKGLQAAFENPDTLQVSLDRVPEGFLVKIFGRYGVKRATMPTLKDAVMKAAFEAAKERL